MIKLCLIGPFPPPMNGNSKALDTLVKSGIFTTAFKCYKINLNQTVVGQSGRFSLEKVRVTTSAAKEVNKLKNENIDCFYLTTAQSKFGLIRDFLIVRSIKKTNPNAKIIAHLHGGGFKNFYDKSSSIVKLLVRKTYKSFDRVIVLSDSLIDMFEGIYPKEKIAVRYNCVDDEFLFDENEIINKSEDRSTINVTYLSNMIESKGYLYVLSAAKKMFVDFPSVKFFFAGNFPSEKQRIAFEEELESEQGSNTQYLGVVSGEDKKELLRITDIFVLPTRYPPEGQPISIIEAMGAGAVILTTDQGGIPDIIHEGINGYIMNNNFEEEIIKHITTLVNDSALRSRIGIHNTKYVQENFTEKHYIQGLIDIMLDVCGR